MTPVRFPLNSGDHKGACPLVQSFPIRGTPSPSLWAPAFYEGLGYTLRASIPEYPQGFAQLHYFKRLRSTSGDSGCNLSWATAFATA